VGIDKGDERKVKNEGECECTRERHSVTPSRSLATKNERWLENVERETRLHGNHSYQQDHTNRFVSGIESICSELKKYLIMTSKSPTVQRHRLRGHIVRGCHSTPLRIEKNLQAVRSCGQIDDQHGHTRVCLICHWRCRIRCKPHGTRSTERCTRRRIEDADFHRLSIKAQRRRRPIGGYRRVSLHAPLHSRCSCDFVLNENLFAPIQQPNPTLNRRSNFTKSEVAP